LDCNGYFMLAVQFWCVAHKVGTVTFEGGLKEHRWSNWYKIQVKKFPTYWTHIEIICCVVCYLGHLISRVVWYIMYGMVWYGMVLYGMVWYGMVWYGMVWYGMVWYGMVWYMIWSWTVCASVGLVPDAN
jgi:hypothetical protein